MRIITASILILSSITYCFAVSDVISFHRGVDCTGTEVTLPKWDYYYDLADHGVDNVAFSIQIQGMWLLYDLKEYNNATNAGVEFLDSPEFSCHNLDATAGKLSSLRKVGSENSDERGSYMDTLTLYWLNDFQGIESTVYQYSQPHWYDHQYKSLIIVGKTGWTLYDEIDFGGLGICIQPNPTDPSLVTFVPNMLEFDPPIPSDFIKSIRYGCLQEDIIVHV